MKVIISGGELFNKGAQSMTLSVVSEVKKRFPDADVSLLSARDARRSNEEKSQYRFSFLPWDLRMMLRGFPLLRLIFKSKYFSAEQENEMWQKLRSADLAIDISGFCLSSQFPSSRVFSYLLTIWFFRKYKIKTMLFPQSFGPFDFGPVRSLFFKPLIKSVLSHPDKIFPRETDGQKHLAKLGVFDNVKCALDSVLQTSKLQKELIFTQSSQGEVPDIKPNSVCIVPNQKTFLKNSGNALLDVYQDMIESILDAGKNVYLVRHAQEDLDIIKKVKACFIDNENVIALEDDFNALQLTQVISQMDFLVASRYHAVVHAYKTGKPCLVMGWAVKYQELTGHFRQQKYCFDVTSTMQLDSLKQALKELLQQYPAESEVIAKRLGELELGKLFDEALGVV